MRSKSRREVLRAARKGIAEVAPLWHRQGLIEDTPNSEIRRFADRVAGASAFWDFAPRTLGNRGALGVRAERAR